MTTFKIFSAAGLGAILSLCIGSANAEGMRVTSTAFSDNGVMPALYAGEGAGCGGKGVSPQVAWSNLPAGTKSVAILLFDPDGNKGLSVSHWVAYNIASEAGQLKEGAGQVDSADVTVGKNISGAAAYRGACPPAGDVPHHYVMTVIASDLAPMSLPKGLNRDELLAALKGHTFAGQSVVGRYGQ